MWADKFLARATIRGYDEILTGNLLATVKSSIDEDKNSKNLSKEEKHTNGLNKKAYHELILSCNDKISFNFSAMTL